MMSQMRAALGLSLLGMVLCGYSVLHHLKVHVLGVTDAVCNVNRLINCDRIALSAFSEVLGVPLGVWGFAYFAGMALLLLCYRRASARRSALRGGLVVASLVASVACLGLASVSAFRLHSVCLVCCAIHFATIGQAAIVFFFLRPIPSTRRSWPAATAMLAALAVLVALVAVGWTRAHGRLEKKLIAYSYREASKLYEKGIDGFLDREWISLPAAPMGNGGEDITFGLPDAPVVLTEFVDFTCPTCAQFAPILKDLQRVFGDRLFIVLKHSPLEVRCNHGLPETIHRNACFAAELAYCVAKQGRFDDAYGDLFRLDYYETALTLDGLGTPGVDHRLVERCQTAPETRAKIEGDTALANRLKVTGTPTLFLNGRRYVAPISKAHLNVAIRLLLTQANRQAANP